jgi:hypothetical protein
MKTLLIFCALLAFVKSDAVEIVRWFQSALNSISAEDVDGYVLSPTESIRSEELKCLHTEFNKDANNERINEKIDNLVCYLHRVLRAPDFNTEDVDVKHFDFKSLQKLCWAGKPVIKDLVHEVKSLSSTCVKNSETFANFFEHFVEKAFDFACNLEKENFADYGEDLELCFLSSVRTLYENCIVQHFADPIEILDSGLCQ